MSSIELTRYGKRLVARTPFELREHAAALPGAVWDKSHRVWTYPATVGTAARLHNVLREHGELSLDDDVSSLMEWARRAAAARPYRLAELDALPEVPSKTEAWLHQRRAWAWGREQEGALLTMEMGTGKSKVAVDLVNEWKPELVIVLAPKSVVGGWLKQFRLHSLADYHVTRGEVISRRGGKPKKNPKPAERIEAIEAARLRFDAVVVIVNYELAWRDPFREWILAHRGIVTVTDEGHRVRSPGGRIGQFAGYLRDTSLGVDGGRRIELTGTVMPHSPLDLYGQGRYVEPALFGTSYERFKNRYGKPRVHYWDTDVNEAGELVQTPVYLTDAGGRVIVDGVRDEVRDELADKLASVSFHVGADEALPDLPRELDDVITVELGAKSSKAYRELDEHLVTAIGAGEVTVDNALTRLLRLQQITAGHLPVDVPCSWCDGKPGDPFGSIALCRGCGGRGAQTRIETIGTEKRDALAELLADLPRERLDPRTFEPVRPEPVLTFGRFDHDLLAVQHATETAGRGPFRELSGGRRDALTDESTLAPDTGVAGVQIDSGAEGVDFTLARLTVYYSLGYSLMRYKQSRSRTRRPGADGGLPVEYRHLCAVLDDGTPTVDFDVMDALAARAEVVELVIARMRARAERDR